MIMIFIMIGGLLFKSEIVNRTAYLVFILAAQFASPTLTTGKGAKEVIVNLANVDESLIEKH